MYITSNSIFYQHSFLNSHYIAAGVLSTSSADGTSSLLISTLGEYKFLFFRHFLIHKTVRNIDITATTSRNRNATHDEV